VYAFAAHDRRRLVREERSERRRGVSKRERALVSEVRLPKSEERERQPAARNASVLSDSTRPPSIATQRLDPWQAAFG
jgi:hypothetical protein